jgi:dipeptidyl aminopeptidase/acylaminoacyl peptidase
MAYGGFVLLDHRRAVAVREDQPAGRAEPRDCLVVLALDGDNPDGGEILAQGADFYFSPAVSATGWVAWMEYDHPSMPWGTTRIVAASPTGARVVVADAPGVAALYPQWDGDALVFLADESGYWNFHRWADGRVTRLHDHPFDFCEPPWVLGRPPYALLPGASGTTVGCTWWQDGRARLGTLAGGELIALATYGAATVGPATDGASLALLSTETAPTTLTRLDWSTGHHTRIATESDQTLPAAAISRPQTIRWPASDSGEPVYGWYYPPLPAPAGPPPVLVWPHSGPTSYSPATFSLATQFFTGRGIGVFEVNYSGSSTLGRAYRERLDGAWGVADVRDSIDGARHLVERGLADRDRLAIIGSSAGGFTALAALTTTAVFSAGISLYGVADLAALARDTTKFEAHYTESLVAPYPAGRAVYAERSPVGHVDRVRCPVLLLQGALDPVVPPAQARAMDAALRARGVDAELVLYADEGHGFRAAATIEDAHNRILAFLTRVWA